MLSAVSRDADSADSDPVVPREGDAPTRGMDTALSLRIGDPVTLHDRTTMTPVGNGTVTHLLGGTVVVETTRGHQRLFTRRTGHGLALADDLCVRRAVVPPTS